MSLGGTAAYGRPGAGDVPEIVGSAVSAAMRIGFEFCVRPEIGRLLAVCAAGLPVGSLVAESGTGTGAGLAWMVSGAGPGVDFISYERDPDRAAVAQHVFEHLANVHVVCGDASDCSSVVRSTSWCSTVVRGRARRPGPLSSIRPSYSVLAAR